ncbi:MULTISPECIES: VanZ family protein [Brucella/Ochrobactrum group]|uniref:VanZ family protein n=1 Tax=Brucella/Ochrobactrum group TaxID=2826938 RepID=UPI001654C8C8|nr:MULTISPECIES: VanZ family protein [Brucella/Ochrobactrum group]MBC8717318.1 VanZ family protein [Ochrobactrum sp. Marseille-Q0166]
MKHFLRLAAWLVLISILVVTISPIQFRPIASQSADLERFSAFFLVGFLFALAYPRHWIAVLLLTIGCAGIFELLQRLAPGRHGEFPDFVFKAVGAMAGVCIGRGLSLLPFFSEESR